MNVMFHKQIAISKVIIATLVVFLGYMGLFYGTVFTSTISMAVLSLLGIAIVFTPKIALAVFAKPINPIKTTVKYFVLCWIVSMVIGAILSIIFGFFGFHLSANPIDNSKVKPLIFLISPISLMGEELFSFYFLSILTSKFSLIVSNILSSIIFGLAHCFTYNDGNILATFIHVIFIQGSVRLVLNQALIKSNSIWISWIIHLLYDLAPIIVLLLMKH